MQLLKNLKVRNKLLLLITLSILITFVISTIAYTQLRAITQNIEAIYEDKFIPNDWLNNAIKVNLRIDSIIIQMATTTDPQEKKALHNEIDDGVDQVLYELGEYAKLPLTEEEQKGLEDFYYAVERLTEHQDNVINLALAGKNTEAYQMFRDIVKQPREDLVGALEKLSQIKNQQTEQIMLDSTTAAKKTLTKNIFISLIGIIVVLVLGILISRMITNPLGKLRQQLQKVQNGDFTVQGTYDSKDEIGLLTTSFNETFQALRGVLEKVKSTSDHVDNTSQELMANVEQSTSAAEHVVASIQEISSGAEQTQYRLEENAIVITRVSDGFTNIHHSIQEVEKLASQSLKEAMAGSSIVGENVTQMKNIKQSIQHSNDVVQTLANQVSEVDEILKVIDTISQQTNLLALNAAIEAARAGEHGNGFAVVADEVRKLAEQSMSATKSVANILSNIKKDTAESVQIMSIVIKEADNGLVVTENTAAKFQDILKNTTDVKPVMQKATNAVENIVADFNTFTSSADAILHISINNSKNSEMVSAASEQQAAAMEDMQHSSRTLANVATELNDVVRKFTI